MYDSKIATSNTMEFESIVRQCYPTNYYCWVLHIHFVFVVLCCLCLISHLHLACVWIHLFAASIQSFISRHTISRRFIVVVNVFNIFHYNSRWLHFFPQMSQWKKIVLISTSFRLHSVKCVGGGGGERGAGTRQMNESKIVLSFIIFMTATYT